MNKMLLVSLSLVVSAISAQAAQLETCINTVTRKCGSLSFISAFYSVNSNKCNMMNGGEREDGTRYSQKVIFKDSNTLYSVDMQTCQAARADIYGQFKEEKQLKGRMYAVTQDGRVIVITRTNTVAQLLNSRNQPYKSVVDIKIDQRNESVELTFENRQTTVLDAQELNQKVNHPNALISRF